MGTLDGRTVLVTGSTSGIGRAIALRLAAEGAYAIVSGRDADRGGAVVSAIREAGGRADFVAADLSTAEAAQGLAAATLELVGGRLDILVNNAGISPGTATLSLDVATYDRVMDLNVRGPVFLTQALLPSMLSRSQGVIINIGSWVAQVGFIGGALYSASKATLEQLTRGWASEFGGQGIRVNAIAPGVIISDPKDRRPSSGTRWSRTHPSDTRAAWRTSRTPPRIWRATARDTCTVRRWSSTAVSWRPGRARAWAECGAAVPQGSFLPRLDQILPGPSPPPPAGTRHPRGTECAMHVSGNRNVSFRALPTSSLAPRPRSKSLPDA